MRRPSHGQTDAVGRMFGRAEEGAERPTPVTVGSAEPPSPVALTDPHARVALKGWGSPPITTGRWAGTRMVGLGARMLRACTTRRARCHCARGPGRRRKPPGPPPPPGRRFRSRGRQRPPRGRTPPGRPARFRSHLAPERPDLDGRRGGEGRLPAPRQDGVEVRRLDHQPADMLFGLGEGPVCDQHLLAPCPSTVAVLGGCKLPLKTQAPDACIRSRSASTSRWLLARTSGGGTGPSGCCTASRHCFNCVSAPNRQGGRPAGRTNKVEPNAPKWTPPGQPPRRHPAAAVPLGVGPSHFAPGRRLAPSDADTALTAAVAAARTRARRAPAGPR